MEARFPIFFETVPLGSRIPARRERTAGATANGAYEVELRPAAQIGADLAAWQTLTARALEPALFGDPDMLLPAFQHLPEGRQAVLLLVWQRIVAGRVLRGLFPVLMPKLPIAPGEVRLWRLFGFSVAPALVDRDCAEAVFGAVFSFCAARGARCSCFVLSGAVAGGALAAATASAGRRNEALPVPGLWASRAMEPAAAALHEAPATSRVERACSASQVRDAVEAFLVLDAAQAKLRGRMALIEDAGTASFIRTATRQLARRRLCRVDVLREGKDALAATILFEGPDALWVWQAVGPHRPLQDLIRLAAARVARTGKRLVFCGTESVAPAAAAELGFEPLPLADLLVPTRAGLSPSAAVTRLKTRIDRRLRAIASGGLQRLMRA